MKPHIAQLGKDLEENVEEFLEEQKKRYVLWCEWLVVGKDGS